MFKVLKKMFTYIVKYLPNEKTSLFEIKTTGINMLTYVCTFEKILFKTFGKYFLNSFNSLFSSSNLVKADRLLFSKFFDTLVS